MKRIVLSALALAGGTALAHEGDYGLVIQDGVVVTGLGDHDAQQVTDIGLRVFAAEMSLTAGNWAGDEPGIFIEAGAMPDGVGVGFVIESALRRWDGQGPVDFSSIPAQTMTLEFGPWSVSTPLIDTEVVGFSIPYDADNPGGFDEHYEYLLDAEAGAGIYLLRMRFTVDGFADSLSTWTVFNAGLDEAAHDAAIKFVEANYVPAPGGLALVGFGLAATGRRRSRNRAALSVPSPDAAL